MKLVFSKIDIGQPENFGSYAARQMKVKPVRKYLLKLVAVLEILRFHYLKMKNVTYSYMCAISLLVQ